jgi:hypothetical protein
MSRTAKERMEEQEYERLCDARWEKERDRCREPVTGDWYYNKRTREWEYTGDEPEDEEDADQR